jgi:hypothetical protein
VAPKSELPEEGSAPVLVDAGTVTFSCGEPDFARFGLADARVDEDLGRVFRRLEAMHKKCMLWFESCLPSHAFPQFAVHRGLCRKARIFRALAPRRAKLRRSSWTSGANAAGAVAAGA